jgi:copper chaperone CopZ
MKPKRSNRPVLVAGLAAAVALSGLAEARAASGPAEETLTFEVEGMQSAMCAIQVRSTLERLAGVATVAVDREAASARVEYDPEQVTPGAMAAALSAAGYRTSLPAGTAPPGAGAHAVMPDRLTPAQVDRVAEFVAGRLLEQGALPAGDAVREATGLDVRAADLPAVQAAVVMRLAAEPRGQQFLEGNRCNDYGACSLWRNLATASGEELARYERDRSRDGERLHGAPLPGFTAHDLDEQAVRSRDLTGRPSLVTLLAVHCTHSMDTFPVLQELHRRYGPQGLQVVGVLVHSGSAVDAREWVPEFSPEYPIWIHEDASLGEAIGSRLVPTHLLLDGDGRMQQILVGFKSEEQVAGAVESVLGLSAAGAVAALEPTSGR